MKGTYGQGCVYRRGEPPETGKDLRPWYIKYSDGKAIYRESSKTHRKGMAVRLLERRKLELLQGRVGAPKAPPTLWELRQLVLDNYEKRGQKTARRVEYLFANLGRLLGRNTPADRLADRLDEYVTARLREKIGAKPKEGQPDNRRTVSRATVNREASMLRRAFRLGKVRRLWPDDFEFMEEKNVRKGVPEREEIEAIIGKLPERLQELIRFLSITGWRVGEALALEWRSVNLDAGVIRLEGDETKGGEVREYPFAERPELVALVAARKGAADAWQAAHGEIVRHVFWYPGKDENGRPTASRNRQYRHQWEAACVESGHPGRLVHDLRRYAARSYVRAGIPVPVAMQLMGHRTRSCFDRYSIMDDTDRREAVRKVARMAEVGC
jgi:integrase